MKICFVNATNPSFLGGTSQYVNNLISSGRMKNDDITWIYKSSKNKKYVKKGITYVELKVPRAFLINEFVFNWKVLKILRNEYFDVINSHAVWGYWMKSYKKKKGQRIVHMYHGSTYHFFKNHFGRFNIFRKIFYSPTLLFSYIIEKPPIRKADYVIYNAEKVKNQLESLFGRAKKSSFIRTGVDVSLFKRKPKKISIKKTKLSEKNIYALYVGRGGYWTKGLDIAVNLAREIYKKDKRFRLITIGPDKSKTSKYLKEPFIHYVEPVSRDLMPYYYSVSDFFFCMSRYEGGAPTMVVSEAIAAGCLIVCSKASQMEVIEDEKNGLILSNFDSTGASKVLRIFGDKRIFNGIKNNASKMLKDISIDKWAKEYLGKFKGDAK